MAFGPDCPLFALFDDGSLLVDPDAGKVYTTRAPRGTTANPAELGAAASNGYRRACVGLCGNVRHITLHRAVWASANGPIPPGKYVCHRNNDKADNRIANLYLGTPRRNSQDAARDGLYPTGEDHHAAKIPDDESLADRYRAGERVCDLADRFGVSRATVYRHLRRDGVTFDWKVGEPRK